MDAGIYDDMSNAAYLAQTDWLSASMLKHHLPDHFKKPTAQTSDALDFGSAVHTRLLGAGDKIVPIVASDWRTNAAKDARKQAYELEQIPLLEKDIQRVDVIEAAARAHREANDLLFVQSGRAELSVFADVDGIPSRCRVDRLVGTTAVDVKTTTVKPSVHALTRAVLDYGYDVQADHYLRVLSAAGLDVDTFVFVFINKDADSFVNVVELDASFFARAEILRELALERRLHPEIVEPYPGAHSRLTLSVPRYAQLG